MSTCHNNKIRVLVPNLIKVSYINTCQYNIKNTK
uniref:PARP catalytic domain-containing protein n=1 Tax=Rhizophora mucronata TaxID=61149 RepID=A0A2P2LPZ6_RHIMU